MSIDIRSEGRRAFHAHGAAGETEHSYSRASAQHRAFLEGYWSERFAAADRARLAGRAYQAMCALAASR